MDGMDSFIFSLVLVPALREVLPSSGIAATTANVGYYSGLLFALFYMLTACAAIVYYRRRVFSNVWDSVLVGILPLASVVFLGWVVVKSLQGAPNAQRYALIGIVIAGLIMMFVARFALRSQFFHLPRESAPREAVAA